MNESYTMPDGSLRGPCPECGILGYAELCQRCGGKLTNCPECGAGCAWWDDDNICSQCGTDHSGLVATQGRRSVRMSGAELSRALKFLYSGKCEVER